MYTHPIGRLLEDLEGVGVRGDVGGIDVVPDPALSIGGPRSHPVLFIVGTVFGDLTDKSGESVSPTCCSERDPLGQQPTHHGKTTRTQLTFSHPASLAVAETTTVLRASSQTSRQPVRILVDDDTCLQITVTEGLSSRIVERQWKVPSTVQSSDGITHGSGIPDVHPHPRLTTIRRGHKV
jgi:hypothetical protein